jgi:hypothetical protein
MRWAGIAFVIFPLVYYAGEGIKALKTKDSSEIRFLVLQILIAMISFGITISPQLVLWQRLYGSLLVMPQGPEAFVEGILPVNTLKVFSIPTAAAVLVPVCADRNDWNIKDSQPSDTPEQRYASPFKW